MDLDPRKWACSGEGTHPVVYLMKEDKCPYCNSRFNWSPVHDPDDVMYWKQPRKEEDG